jgi:hypothetical protein
MSLSANLGGLLLPAALKATLLLALPAVVERKVLCQHTSAAVRDTATQTASAAPPFHARTRVHFHSSVQFGTSCENPSVGLT